MSARLPCQPASAPFAAFFAFRTTVTFSAATVRALLLAPGQACLLHAESDSPVTLGADFV